MLINSLITDKGNHVVSTEHRFFILTSTGKILRESWLEEYNHLITKCEVGKIELSDEMVNYLENQRTTISGIELIGMLSLNQIYQLLTKPMLFNYKVSAGFYYIFDKVEGNIISGFCWNHDPSDVNMHGVCIINKKEIVGFRKLEMLRKKEAKQNVQKPVRRKIRTN